MQRNKSRPTASKDDGIAPETGLTLPLDFPAHLLLRICDAILQPALSPHSPIRPHQRPWIRTSPPRTPCKSDLLGFITSSKRIYTICSEQIYRHLRVATLAAADMLVSRRNVLKNTQVLELFFYREQDITQAQTDLNLNRLFIQSGIILLWCPNIQDILLDIKALCEPVPLKSFFERFCQRVFVQPGANREEDPGPPGVVPRWNDSQGQLNTPFRVSIPRITIAFGSKAAGEAEGGLPGMLQVMFPLPHESSRIPRLQLATRTIAIHVPNLATITHLDIVLPRPSWGNEEQEGVELGTALCRLAGLRKLGIHASSEFGITRRPLPTLMQPPSAAITQENDEDSDSDSETDIDVQPNGAVLYQNSSNNNAPISKATAPPAQSYYNDNLGPETWWKRVLATIGPKISGLEELRISARGWIREEDFDAFFQTIVDPVGAFSLLETVIFDLEFSLQDPYLPMQERSPQGPPDVVYALYQTHHRWIRSLISGPSSGRRAPALRRIYFGEYRGRPGHTEMANPKPQGSGSVIPAITAEERYTAKMKASAGAQGVSGSSSTAADNTTGGNSASPGSPGYLGSNHLYGSRPQEAAPSPSMASGQRIVPGTWWTISGDSITRGWVDD